MIKVSILTLSDKGSKGERKDESAPVIEEILKSIDCTVAHYEMLPDDREMIKEKLISMSMESDLILTTGGTGLSPRDVTPQATLDVIDTEIPGIAEAMRASGLQKTPRSMLSRAVAGVLNCTLIINLPGSPKAVRENLSAVIDVIPHAINKIKGDMEDCAR